MARTYGSNATSSNNTVKEQAPQQRPDANTAPVDEKPRATRRKVTDDEIVDEVSANMSEGLRRKLIIAALVLFLLCLIGLGVMVFRSGIISRVTGVTQSTATIAASNADSNNVATDKPRVTKSDDVKAQLEKMDVFHENKEEGYSITDCIADTSQDNIIIRGKVRNDTEDTHNNVSLGVYLMDADGTAIGLASATVAEIKPGATWTFEATSDVASGDVHRFQLAEVNF